MFLAMALIPMADTAGKLLTSSRGVEPGFVAFSRFLLGLLVLFPFLGRPQFHLFLNWRIWLRGMLLAGGIFSILTALKTEPIANVFAAFFIGPILSYFLSAALLKEQISRWRSVLLLVGFSGVLLVVKPGLDMGPGMGFAVIAGLFYGSYLVANRWLHDLARPRMLFFSQLVVGSVVLTPIGLTHVPPLSLDLSVLILISAVFSGVGNLCLVLAYRRMGASQLAPLVYLQLITATVMGILVFDTWPDQLALLGLILLITSGFLSFVKLKPVKPIPSPDS